MDLTLAKTCASATEINSGGALVIKRVQSQSDSRGIVLFLRARSLRRWRAVRCGWQSNGQEGDVGPTKTWH